MERKSKGRRGDFARTRVTVLAEKALTFFFCFFFGSSGYDCLPLQPKPEFI